MRHLFLIAFVLIVIVGGCEASRSPTTPSPPPVSSMVFTGVSPPSGSTILLPVEYPYILPGGKSSEFCGDNGPDAPTWSFLTTGWTTTYSATGFRVYRLPGEVTGIRAMLHTEQRPEHPADAHRDDRRGDAPRELSDRSRH